MTYFDTNNRRSIRSADFLLWFYMTYLDTRRAMKKISSFRGQYFFLSNYFTAPVTYQGITFQNNEAAFHAMKCPSMAAQFATLPPDQAKRLGRTVQLRGDWESVKEQIMYEICLAKFTQNKDLGRMLVATGDAELIEGNTWNDKCWGVCDGEGENKLGKILMRVREEVR